MIAGGFTISTVCSVQFAVVHRHNVTDVVSVQKVVRAINYLTLNQGWNEISFKIFTNFHSSHSTDR